jgi:hypothetical protein
VGPSGRWRAAPVVPLLLFLCYAHAAAQAPGSDALRLVAYGDDEGTCRRWNERASKGPPCQTSAHTPGPSACPRGQNARLAELLRHLREQADGVHAILHTGDFVRHDRNVDRYAAALGPLVGRFFPTTGGDQEFRAGRFRAFIERHAPHIALGDRAVGDFPRCRLCYHVYWKTPDIPFGLHVVSLENPDQYGDEKAFYKPHCAPTHDLYRAPRGGAAAGQFAWLRETLDTVAQQRAGPGRPADAAIVLTHRPVPLAGDGSADLVALFARARVDLVLGGNVHAYARGEAQGVHYFVTGVTGDRLVGGCTAFLPRGYTVCRPETPWRHAAAECGGTECDHFLELLIARETVTVRARLIDRLPGDQAMETVTWARPR